MSASRRPAWPALLAAIVAVGAALRFATLGVQSFWLDEAVTHDLVTRPLWAMLSAIPHSESTPPLYYVAAWIWVRVFGAGEVGLRSLSALFGTATIVVLALIARRLAGSRAGLAAAALAATSPLLIWYGQEARAYALLVLLCALSVWLLARGDWWAWGLACVLALATHYFAVFIVVPEMGWVAWRVARGSRRALFATAVIGLIGVALLPLAIVQSRGNRAAFITTSSLASRVAAVPKQFLVGYATPAAALLTVLASVVAVALAFGLRRADRGLLGLAALALGIPLVLAIVGADYVITRNLIAAMVPLVVLAGVASTRKRAGPGLIAALCLTGVVAFVGVELTPADQRDDWRAIARAIAPVEGPYATAVVVDPASGALPLAIYAPLRPMYSRGAIFSRAIDVVALGRDAPVPVAPLPLAGFAATVVHTPEYTLVRYVATGTVEVDYTELAHLALVAGPPYPTVLVGANVVVPR
jgi:uncharacterized membrane protein